MAFQVGLENQGEFAVARAQGEIDLATVELLDLAVESALSEGVKKLVIDLTEVTFLDSTGVRSLLSTDERVRALGGELTIVVAGGPVSRTLSVTAVDKILRIVDGLPEGES